MLSSGLEEDAEKTNEEQALKQQVAIDEEKWNQTKIQRGNLWNRALLMEF